MHDLLYAPPDGTLQIKPPVSRAGQGMSLVAERDVFVGVTSCATPTVNSGGARPM